MIFDLIESVKDYSVVFVGDTIVDEYHYVTPLGKSPKENIVPVKFEDSEWFMGGTHAAANHARTFCKHVDICTGGKPIRKVRLVDRNYLRKLFEVHYEEKEYSYDPLPDADVTVVTDFGHGFITQGLLYSLSNRPLLAVNAQTNAANIGFNLITKYEKADYVVIDEPEARLAAQDRDSPLQEVMVKLAKGRYKKIIVTRGNRGAAGWCEDAGYHECNAYTDKVLDTMGAGDAFFAVTAPMAMNGHIKDLLAIGNAAGALKTQIVGHRASVTKERLVNFLLENGAK